MSRVDRAPAPVGDAGFLDAALPRLAADPRLVGVAAGGSYLTGAVDEWSDLDLVSAVEPAAWERVLAERCAIAARLGPLLVAFAGEHVGEPRLLVCLYGRGELLEAADALALIRGLALGPLALASRGARPSGARKIEQVAPDVAPRFHRTVAASDLRSSLAALAHPGRCRNEAAEAAAVAYARDVEARVG